MTHLVSMLFFCLLIFVNCEAVSQNGYQKRIFTTRNGQKLPYRILFPRNYDQSKKYPLVLFLHGSGERGNDNEKQLAHGGSLFAKTTDKFPAIVVFPQCPSSEMWTSAKLDHSTTPSSIRFAYNDKLNWPLQAAVDLVKQLSNSEKVDTRRMYIAGVSMGGMGTFEVLARYPDLFAAAVPVCGGGNTQLVKAYADKVPVWIFHGAEDNVVNPAYSREMYQALKSLKAEVTYTEYPGVKHNSWDKAFAEPQLLPWLFSQQQK